MHGDYPGAVSVSLSLRHHSTLTLIVTSVLIPNYTSLVNRDLGNILTLTLFPELLMTIIDTMISLFIHFRNLHLLRTGSIEWFFHSVARFNFLEQLERVNTWVRGLSSTEHLPACHSIGPLKRRGNCIIHAYFKIFFIFVCVSHVNIK